MAANNNSQQVNVDDIKVRFEVEKRPRYDLSALPQLKYKEKGRNNRKSRATRSPLYGQHGEVDQTNEAAEAEIQLIHQLQREPDNVQMGFDDYNNADKTIYDPHISKTVHADDIETFEVIFLQQYKQYRVEF